MLQDTSPKTIIQADALDQQVNSTGIPYFGEPNYPYSSSITLGTPTTVLNQCYPGSANPVAVASSIPPTGSSTRMHQGYLCSTGQLDDSLPAYNINQLSYPAPYSDTNMTTSLYKSPDAYNLWSADLPGPRSQSIPENLRRASLASPRYLVPTSGSASSSSDLSAFPSMTHLGNTLPIPRLPSSRPRHSIGSNVHLRSNGVEVGNGQTDMSQLQPGSGVKASTNFPWLDERLGDNYLSSSHIPSTGLSATIGASYAPITPGLTQDVPLLPHRSSYDFTSQLYSRNPSASQGADATESLTNLEQYSLSRNAPQPARSPSNHSSTGSISYENGGSKNYAFLSNVYGNGLVHPSASSVSGAFPTQASSATSLPSRNLSVASITDAQSSSSQAFTTPHGLSRQASTRQLAADASRHSISDASTDSSGK